MYTCMRGRWRERERERDCPHLMVIIVIELLVNTLQNSPPTLPPSGGHLELKHAITTPLRNGDSL